MKKLTQVCHSGLDPESHEILNQVQDGKKGRKCLE